MSHVNLYAARARLTLVCNSAERPGVAPVWVLPRLKLRGAADLIDDYLGGPIGVVEVLVGKCYCLCRSVEARKGEHGYDPGNLSFIFHNGSLRRGPGSPHRLEMKT